MKRMVFTALLISALVGTIAPAAVLAAAPGNDNFANATVIDPSALPFTDTQSIDEATSEGETVPCGSFNFVTQTVWYSITPTTTGVLRAADSASFYYQFLVVYRQDGSGLAGLVNVGCSTWYFGQSSATVSVESGKTYYIVAGSNFLDTGSISVTVTSIDPPTNDDFADARVVGPNALPFAETTDLTASSIEADEPQPSCVSGQTPGSMWYSFTPTVSGSYMASALGLYAQIAVYTGPALDDLTEVACFSSPAYSQLLTFRADAGTTYRIQVGPWFYGSPGLMTFELGVAPAPVAAFGWSPGDPSTVDTIAFSDHSSDPAQAGIVSQTWTFGDGTSLVNPTSQPLHRYAADGTYTVRLVVTTRDGRTAAASQVLVVATHDIAITKFSVPNSARVNQTRVVTVGISNRRYAEVVTVTLYKLTPGVPVLVGTSIQSVPVKSGNKTTDFAFSYTFNTDDALLGKASFQAVASLSSARDAIPGDNQAQSLPVKVTK